MRKIGIILALVLAVGVAAFGAYWRYRLKPYLVIEMTRGQMTRLTDAVVSFNTAKKRLPGSLGEMVVSRFLPDKGDIYFNPMKHYSGTLKPVHYKKCEFDIVFGPKEVEVSVPKEVLSQERFAFTLKRGTWHTRTVTGDVELYTPEAEKTSQK